MIPNVYDLDLVTRAEELICDPDLFSTRDDLMRFLVACGWPRAKVGRMIGVSGRTARRNTTPAKVRLFREKVIIDEPIRSDVEPTMSPAEVEAIVRDYMANPNLTAEERDAAQNYLESEIPLAGRWWILARLVPNQPPTPVRIPLSVAERKATATAIRGRIRAIRNQPGPALRAGS